MIKYVHEVKNGREYVATYTETDPAEVYKDLAGDLVRSKLIGCKGYRVSRKTVYSGDVNQRITVNYGDGVQRHYFVKI